MVVWGHIFTKWLVANTKLRIKYKEISHIVTDVNKMYKKQKNKKNKTKHTKKASTINISGTFRNSRPEVFSKKVFIKAHSKV